MNIRIPSLSIPRTIRRAMAVALVTLSVAALCNADEARRFLPRGQTVRELPHGAYSVPFRGESYFYRGGEWYRPYGSNFRVIAPPLGAVVPVLPGLYATFWFGGIPYYFANDAYYLWRADLGGYVVTEPPPGIPPDATKPAGPKGGDLSEPFVYPMNGQGESQQATDRYECHRWAAEQSSYDPTQPSSSLNTSAQVAARAAYLRAETACLAGRGYSVR